MSNTMDSLVIMWAVAADILSEFVEVAVHSILYSRGLYPHGVFGRKKKYNIPVQASTEKAYRCVIVFACIVVYHIPKTPLA